MHRFLIFLSVLFLLCIPSGAPAENTGKEVPVLYREAEVLPLPEAAGGRLVDIPVEQNSLEVSIAPHAESYLPAGTEEGAGLKVSAGYADPSITVSLGFGRIYETNFVYARIRIASPSQLRTLLASPINSNRTTLGPGLAKRVNAVLAVNGDYCGGENAVNGCIMRQGDMLRLKCTGNRDLLMIDRKGDLVILPGATNEDITALQEQAMQIFTFGPTLILNGEPQYGYENRQMATHKSAQRMAICQTGELEYLVLASEGPEDPGSRGLTIDQLVDLLDYFPDIQTAYNLDGGGSTTLVFRKNDNNWEKVNTPNTGKVRALKDIIYFATAWEED